MFAQAHDTNRVGFGRIREQIVQTRDLEGECLYQVVLENFPNSPRFNKHVQTQYKRFFYSFIHVSLKNNNNFLAEKQTQDKNEI